MLVITRRIGESVLIGSNIRIKVMDAGGRGGTVRIGIDAPQSMRITRQEPVSRMKEDILRHRR